MTLSLSIVIAIVFLYFALGGLIRFCLFYRYLDNNKIVGIFDHNIGLEDL
jgi:hypothetical protein